MTFFACFLHTYLSAGQLHSFCLLTAFVSFRVSSIFQRAGIYRPYKPNRHPQDIFFCKGGDVVMTKEEEKIINEFLELLQKDKKILLQLIKKLAILLKDSGKIQ